MGNVSTIKVFLEFLFFCGPRTFTFAKGAHLSENTSGLEFNFPLESKCVSLNFDFLFLTVPFPRQGTSLPHKEYDYDYAIHKTKIEFQSRKTRVKYGPVVCLPLEVRGRLSVCV